jgi:hypothetical protein
MREVVQYLFLNPGLDIVHACQGCGEGVRWNIVGMVGKGVVGVVHKVSYLVPVWCKESCGVCWPLHTCGWKASFDKGIIRW